MVTAVTNLGRSGLSDWLFQRVTAVILLAYVLFLLVVLGGGVEYAQWRALFDMTWVKVFSLAAILSIGMHAWIGMWTVSTDYLVAHVLRIKVGEGVAAKANLLRWIFQMACAVILFTYVVWGIQILWG